MNITEKKQFSRRLIETVWNEGKVEKLDTFLTPNFTYFDPSGPVDLKGIDAYKKYVLDVRKAFPDFFCKVEDQIAEDDKLVTFLKITATHEGEFFGLPASHKKATIPMIVIERFAGEKIAESYGLWDALTFMRIAGAFEAREPAFASYRR